MKTRKILFISILFSMLFLGIHQAHAVFYNASNEVGAQTPNDTPIYTRAGDGINPQGLQNSPFGFVFDTVNHRLFVSDTNNGRIMVFPLDSSDHLILPLPSASYVLGAPDLYSPGAFAPGQNTFGNPEGLSYDSKNQRLFVADNTNNRVLIFNVATSTIANGENASYVLGQSDFVSSGASTTINTLNTPMDVDYDSASQRLFVSDQINARIMVFNVATSTITNGENASYELGAPDFVTNNSNLTTSTFFYPTGVDYDTTNRRLFVTDQGNNRIMVFNVATSTITNGENASYVIGAPDFVTNSGGALTTSTFNDPQISAYDASSSRLFVPDIQFNAWRVLVFNVATSTIANGENASNVVGASDFFGGGTFTPQNSFQYPQSLSYDPVGHQLLVATGGYGVPIFNVSTSTIANGEDASGILGEYDDNGNYTFLKGGPNNLPTAHDFSYSKGDPAVDPVNHRLFVSDLNDHRFLIFPLDANDNITTRVASGVLGSPNLYLIAGGESGSVSQNTVSNNLGGSAYDASSSRVFVADSNFNRILVFNMNPGTFANGENASYVLGQPDFITPNGTTTQSGLAEPGAVAYDSPNHRLFVADQGNARVMIFNVATSTIANGENASYELGEPDFISSYSFGQGPLTTSTFGNNFITSFDLAYDSPNQRLFVADVAHNRVMVFNVATSTIANSEDASYVIGQPDFVTSNASTTQNQFAGAQNVAYDAQNQRLFVADSGNNRVMIFNVATSTIANGENASGVIGAADFVTSTSSISQTTFVGSLYGIAYDTLNNNLFTVDNGINRIIQDTLIGITTLSLPNGKANQSYSQTINTTSSQGTVSFSLTGTLPSGLSFNTSTGVISGTPSAAATKSFTISANDVFGDGSIFIDSILYTIQTSFLSSGQFFLNVGNAILKSGNLIIR